MVGLRQKRMLNLIVCLVFCLNFALSDMALAMSSVTKTSMLRPPAAGEESASKDGGQIVWMLGDFMPSQFKRAQDKTKEYLAKAFDENRVFTSKNIPEQIAAYSATRFGDRDLLLLKADEIKDLEAKLTEAFSFHEQALASITDEDIKAAMGRIGVRADVLNKLKNNLNKARVAMIFDEDGNPTFYSEGAVGTPKFIASTLSAGGYAYKGYDEEALDMGYGGPQSIYLNLDIVRSYIELAKADPEAAQAYKLKVLQAYLVLNGQVKDYLKNFQQNEGLRTLIDKYDTETMRMWKGREEAKAKARLAREKNQVIMENRTFNLAKFLDPSLDGIIPQPIIDAIREELYKLEVSGFLLGKELFANSGKIHIQTNRSNGTATDDDVKAIPAVLNAVLKGLEKAKEMGIYNEKAGDLWSMSYIDQLDALDVMGQPVPFKTSERAADPVTVVSFGRTNSGALNAAIVRMLANRDAVPGLTLDMGLYRGFFIEILDKKENKTFKLDTLKQLNHIYNLLSEPGRYVPLAAYTKKGHQVPSDEPWLVLSFKRLVDKGREDIPDSDPVIIVKGQSGLPAVGEIVAAIIRNLTIVYGENETPTALALRPTSREEANKLTARETRLRSLVVGYGYQAFGNGRIGNIVDFGGDKTLQKVRDDADWFAQQFLQAPPYWHNTEIGPITTPHEYTRNDPVRKTFERLTAAKRFEHLPSLKDGEYDPYRDMAGDWVEVVIKADTGSGPGHVIVMRLLIYAQRQFLKLAQTYGFKATKIFLKMIDLYSVLNTGMTIEQISGRDGVYMKNPTNAVNAVNEKVSAFKNKVKIASWDDAIRYLSGKDEFKDLLAMATTLKNAGIDYAGLMKDIDTLSTQEAEKAIGLSGNEKLEREVAIIKIMQGMNAGTFQALLEKDANFRQALGLTTDISDQEKILDYRVYAVGDDAQLKMRHNLKSPMDPSKLTLEAIPVDTLAWDTLWYAANQATYFKPYGWKQDMLKTPTSGNIQGAGPGKAGVIVRKTDKAVESSSGDKESPSAFSIPLVAMFEKAIGEGKYKNKSVVAEIIALEKSTRGFFDLTDAQDLADAIALLRADDEFAIKAVYITTEKWDKKKSLISVPLEKSQFEKENLDFDIILSRLLELGYIYDQGNNYYHVNPKFKKLGKDINEAYVRGVFKAEEMAKIEGILLQSKGIIAYIAASASTDRLAFTAGKYVGKDDPTMSVLVTGETDAVSEEEVVELFKNVQMVVGFMRGSHHSKDTVGTALTFEGLEEEGRSQVVYDKLAAIPYLMDGPSAKILMGFPVNAPLSAGKDMFKGQPWVEKMNEASRRMSEFILNCGGFPAFRVFGHATEYTTLPETQGAIKKLKWEQPAGNALEAQVLKSTLGIQSKGIAKKISDAAIVKAKDSKNRQVIPIRLSVLMSDPSLILAAESINEQINRNFGIFGSSVYIESNAYMPLLIADVPDIKTTADVEKIFAAVTKGTNNGAKATKDIFAGIVTQEDMQEGDISNPADLIKQLQRMGFAPESLQGFLGPNEWVAALKKQPGVSDKAIEGNVDAEGNTIAFAGNALFAVVEAIASPERTLSLDIQRDLDVVMEATSIAVIANEKNPKITDSIELYRNQVEATIRI